MRAMHMSAADETDAVALSDDDRQTAERADADWDRTYYEDEADFHWQRVVEAEYPDWKADREEDGETNPERLTVEAFAEWKEGEAEAAMEARMDR